MNEDHPFRDIKDDMVGRNSDFNSRVENEPSFSDGQSELVSLNMWTKMKNLESKYIDLANFYKQQLVARQSTNDGSAQSSKSAVGGVVQQASSGPGTSEDAIIMELKNEKIKFE